MSKLEDILKNVGAAGTGAVITVTGMYVLYEFQYYFHWFNLLFSHPIDVVKTRLQVSGKNGARNYKALGITGTIAVVAKEEGITAFWKGKVEFICYHFHWFLWFTVGISAAWMREASYTALRIGLYGKKSVVCASIITGTFLNRSYQRFYESRQ